jgi:hypothetical protein
MALCLYTDVHIPLAITEGLRRRSIDVLTSQEDGADRFDDERLLQRATDLGRLLFTQDEDLLAIAARWQADNRPFAGLIYAHQLGPGIGELIEDLELLCVCSEVDEVANQIRYLPLR